MCPPAHQLKNYRNGVIPPKIKNMKPYDREILEEYHEAPETPYMRARQEWDHRIGDARVQAKNWRLVAVFSLFIAAVLLVALLMSLALHQNKVFVAEVTKDGRVVNVAPIEVAYHPSVAEEEYFIGNFIKLVRELPLDPVVAKKNWLNAYRFLTSRGSEKLNTYLQQNNPISLLGKQTTTIEITDVNAISDATFSIDWVENSVDLNGQSVGGKKFSGVFTIILKAPKTEEQILQNPLGIYITDLTISNRV